MAHSRFRVERCAAHGIAVGLCAVGTCRGSAEAKNVPRQLVQTVTPLRCCRCKHERGDAIRRGAFFGANGAHQGHQRAWCDTCWEGKQERDKAAATPKSRIELQLAATKRANRARSDAAALDQE